VRVFLLPSRALPRQVARGLTCPIVFLINLEGARASTALLSGLIRILAEKAPVPVLLHQDHPGKDSNILRSLRPGYYSAMYEGGHLPLAENIAGTTRFAEMAHESGAILESEIGQFGGEYQGGTGHHSCCA
jgi:fructose-bisphosphate aldolase, class II